MANMQKPQGQGAEASTAEAIVNDKRSRFDALPLLEVSSAEVRNIPHDGGGYIGRLVKWLMSKGVIGLHTNDETGWDNIAINRSSVKGVLFHGAKDGKVALLEIASELIKNGIYLETNPKNEAGLTSHIFAGKATIDAVQYAVCYVVREDGNGRRYYDHSLTKIEALDRVNDQAPEITDEKGQNAPQLPGIALKPVGQEPLSNILKKHLKVNSAPQKN